MMAKNYMNRSMFSLLLAAATLIATSAASAQRHAVPTKRITISRNFAGKPIPKWQNGFWAAYDHDQLPVMIYLFDQAGKQILMTELSFPTVIQIRIWDMTVSTTGELAVSGSSMSSTGAAVAFVAWFSPTGKVERIIRTSPFSPLRICMASDGTVWGAGREITPGSRREDERPHNVLNRYDKQGRLLDSLLPRASFATYDFEHPMLRAFLTCTNDRVGIYSTVSREWIEVSSDHVVSRWKGVDLTPDNATTANSLVTGVAWAKDGEVYISREIREPKTGRATAEFYTLNKQSAIWERIDLGDALGPRRWGALYGSDDADQLIVSTGGSTALWLKPQ
jgi:hypothetical protein